jgi:hypothetical protein
MKSDLYTKFVLTVIALSLSVIAIQLTTKDAHAQSGRFVFGSNGALVVTVCDPVNAPLMCADVINGGQLRVVAK